MNKTKNSTFYLLKRFIPYFKPYRLWLIADLFFAAMSTVGELILPLIIKGITNTAIEDLPSLTIKYVLVMGLIYLVVRVIDIVGNYFMQSKGHIMGTMIEKDMRHDTFEHLQKLSFSFYDNVKIGQIMSRITNDLNDISEFAHHFPEEMFIAFIKVTVTFLVLLSMNIKLTLAIFIIVPLMIVVARSHSMKMKRDFAKSRHHLGELNAQVEDSLLGIRVVKSFANEDIEIDKFETGNQLFLKVKESMYYSMASFHAITRAFDALMYITVVVYGAILLINGEISASEYVAYLMYVVTLLAAIKRMVEFMEQYQKGMTGIDRFVDIMDSSIEIFDLDNARVLDSVTGEVSFNNVYFKYQNNKKYTLEGISFDVKRGQHVAFVGPSGSGKTTITNLIQRFYDVEMGSITIDGTNIKDFTLKSLRDNIGVVQQDVYLFSGSVYDNIVYGKPDSTLDEVIEAAKQAGAHEFISELSDGYNTFVGERGTKLSGGQKQRISIARVFLKNPPILIFDEATSALDNENEKVVQDSLQSLANNRTTFVVAHRLTTIKDASIILVLTDEGIVEQGTHDELLELNGEYSKLYSMYVANAELT